MSLLCADCNRIDVRNLGVREYEGLSVAERNKNAFEHKLYRDIVQSASSCNLCRLIHLALERGKNKLIHHMEFLFDASTPLAETRVLLFGNDDIGGWSDWRPGREYGRWGHGKPDEGSALRRRLHSLFVSCRENEGTLHVYAEEAGISRHVIGKPVGPMHSSHPIRQWIGECQRNHLICKTRDKESEDPGRRRPTRLLDVNQGLDPSTTVLLRARKPLVDTPH
ncbi:hypothetical protein ACEPPN_000776 [Leptodophora sp. 'Broadleaf-Isolate-01']